MSMGIYLLNMELPTNCHNCPLCLMRCCQAGGRELQEKETRPKAERPLDCPLVPVPPHGRLGDAEKLFARVTDYYGTSYTIDMICAAPTIIPAEPEEGQ